MKKIKKNYICKYITEKTHQVLFLCFRTTTTTSLGLGWTTKHKSKPWGKRYNFS